MHSIFDVIKRPVISEKSTALSEVAGRFVFEVDPASNKDQIKDAVQKLFNVKVKKVRTMMMHGKVKKVRQTWTKKQNWKKAIVSLEEGQTINFFQGQGS